MTKNEIKAILKSKGMIPVPFRKGQYGFRGGCFEPMTVTNAYLERNAKVEQEVQTLLTEHNITNANFIWDNVPAHRPSEGFDPSYTNYYYILNGFCKILKTSL